MSLRAGDWVEVRSKQEILQGSDPTNCRTRDSLHVDRDSTHKSKTSYSGPCSRISGYSAITRSLGQVTCGPKRFELQFVPGFLVLAHWELSLMGATDEFGSIRGSRMLLSTGLLTRSSEHESAEAAYCGRALRAREFNEAHQVLVSVQPGNRCRIQFDARLWILGRLLMTSEQRRRIRQRTLQTARLRSDVLICSPLASNWPVLFASQADNTLTDFVSDFADDLHGLSFGVRQRPIEFFEAGNVGACITAAHSHKKRSFLCQLR